MKVYNSRGLLGIEYDDPVPLAENMGLSWGGSKLKHKGLYYTHAQVTELGLWGNPNLREYIGGKEVNAHWAQMPHRYVVDVPGNYKEYCPGLRKALQGKRICLVTARVTKHLVFSFQPTNRVFAHTLYVFPLSDYTQFAVLQSRVHESWAWLLSSTLKTDLCYSASDCFVNFPFPGDPTRTYPALEAAGRRVYRARQDWCAVNRQGYTAYYNQLKVLRAKLSHRILHEDLDKAVLEAYGWGDLTVPRYGPPVPGEWHDEVISRLMKLNEERSNGR